MEVTNRQIQKCVTVPCSLTDTWAKWTTHEGLKSFIGYDNKIALRPGGPYEIYFLRQNPEGLRGAEGCTVLSYLPQRMLSFSWNAPPEFAEARSSPHYTWVVLEFEPISDNTTRLILTHLGWPQGRVWEEVFDYFDQAWDKVMLWLTESCKHA